MNREITERVLVIGSGIGGMECALTLAKFGFEVILVEKENEPGGILRDFNTFYQTGISPSQMLEKMTEDISNNDNISILFNARIIKITGELGDFSVIIHHENRNISMNFGVIVLATGFQSRFPDEISIDKSDRIVTHLELEKMLLEKKLTVFKKNEGKKPVALFLNGLISENVLSISSSLKNALILSEEYGYRVFIASSQMKVGSYHLEKLYSQARNIGVVFFRIYDEPPEIIPDNEKPVVVIKDYQLGIGEQSHRLVKIPCDLLVLEEEYSPAYEPFLFDLNLDVTRDNQGFFQQDNVHLMPVHTNREGIFAIGGCRRVGTLSDVLNDAKSAAVMISSIFKKSQVDISKRPVGVDPEKCALCLMCQRFCAFGAITYDRAPVFSPTGCQACGVCAMECPNRAILIEDNDFEKILSD